MLLALDVGNTNIVLGCFDGDNILFRERVSTNQQATDLEYATRIRMALDMYSIDRKQITEAIISSVVPSVTNTLKQAVEKYLGCTPMIVGPGIKTGINIRIDDPSTMGADLVTACVAANAIAEAPMIVISMGTATVLCAIDRQKSLIGCAIAPGLAVSLEALTKNTALLQSVAFQAPDTVIGKNSDKSIRSGVVWGAVCMIDGMIDRMQEEMGAECRVIATGGLSKKIIRYCRHDIEIRENLILEGLRLIYERNRK